MESENSSGTLFRRFMDQLNLFAPSTHSCYTWRGEVMPGIWKSQAGWHRIDFLVLSQKLVHADIQMAHDDDLSFATDADDHISFRADIDVPFTVHGRVASSPLQQTFDRQALLTPEGKEKCTMLMRAFNDKYQQQLWMLPLDRQAVLFSQWFGQSLSAVCPKPKRSKRAQRLSDATWQLLTTSRKARRTARAIQQHVQQACLRAIMHQWSKQRTQARQHSLRRPIVADQPPPGPEWLKACHHQFAKSSHLVMSLKSKLEVALREMKLDISKSSRSRHITSCPMPLAIGFGKR